MTANIHELVPGAIRTTCPYCGTGCGVVARPDGAVVGDTAHPANAGRLCSKGAALDRTLGEAGRLLTPLIRGRPASWDSALDLMAEHFARAIAEDGPDSTGFYVSGQFLTEDYYVANKLMKGFIGSGNIDTNSRLCMASTVAGHIRAFGEDVVPGVYEDIELADLVVLVGSNLAWCHPVLHQRLQAARAQRGTRVVVIDPRRTATADAADLHLPLEGGTDVTLFNGLLVHLAEREALDRAYLAAHCSGFDDALQAAHEDAPSIEATAAVCGIDQEGLETFFDWFATTPRTVTLFSQGVNQSDTGTDKVAAIINCHLATGRIGRPGMGPFSVTGQPNAMGGREVGGLANQLAAHVGFGDADGAQSVRDFWQAPRLATQSGLKAVDLFAAAGQGRVRALWIAGTNPAVSMPRAAGVRDALGRCPFVVVADAWPTDTTALADVVLPAAAWAEKDGTVTNSDRRISRQRAFRAAPGLARPDWWMFAQLAQRLGHGAAFAWQGADEIFSEHAALSAACNHGRRLFDIGGLAGMDRAAYDALEPVQWPLPRGALAEGGRLFAQGGFPTPDRRARLVAVRGQPAAHAQGMRLNTGRLRDQWHTMTRTGLVPALAAHTPEPLLSINPMDAARLGITAGGLVRVSGPTGAATLRATLTHGQRRGEVFAPMHWTDTFTSGGPIDAAVDVPCDPHSGQPALKSGRVAVTPRPAAWHGTLLRADAALPVQEICHWVRIPIEHGQRYRLIGECPVPEDAAGLEALFAALLPAHAATERLSLHDPARRLHRAAVLRDGRLLACLFVAPIDGALPSDAALGDWLGTALTPATRAALLAGRTPAGGEDSPRVCACFGVTRAAVRQAVVTHGLGSTAEIGAFLRAGTNCGSCLPELAEIIADLRVQVA
jgi:assimilatory nitrate reductase catalytic subunit